MSYFTCSFSNCWIKGIEIAMFRFTIRNTTVEEFIDGLLQPHTVDLPSDTKKPDLDSTALPDWFDEKKFNKGRKFYWGNAFGLSTSMLYGLVAVFSVPSILRMLVASQRSSSVYTAFRRYLSTLLHTASWFENELKPGTVSWRSLHEVRSRHFRAGVAAKAKGIGTVSQRDIALTQFGFMGFAVLKPKTLGLQQLEPGDWDAYVYVWRVIGYMIGLEDRYNICRNTYAETLEVCQILQERVFTPALTNVPEYFEHMSRVMLDGLWCINPISDMDAVLYLTKYLADVPGYIFFEDERIQLQKRLREHLKDKPIHTGISASAIVEKPAIEGLPEHNSTVLYYHDFDTITSAPAYKSMTAYSKYRLTSMVFLLNLCSYYWGRLFFNINYSYVLFLAKYFPYLAFFRFGIKNSLVDLFIESPKDTTQPKPNSEYYKVQKSEPWYRSVFRFIFGMLGLAR